MRLAPSVIVLVRDVDGFGLAIADGFRPDPNSNLSRESSTFELSLEKYGVKDRKASGDLIQFVDPLGSPKVSIFLLQNYSLPVVPYAIRELLASLPSQTTLVLPFVMKALKVNKGAMNEQSANEDFVIYTTEIGGTSELTKAMINGMISAPPSLQIHCESLACLLLMARILNLPTVLLLASGPKHPNGQSSYPELEAYYGRPNFLPRDDKLSCKNPERCRGRTIRRLLFEQSPCNKYQVLVFSPILSQLVIKVLEKLGGTVARHLGFVFSKDLIPQKNIEKSTSVGEPWRALYG